MTGDELVVEVDADPVRIGFDRLVAGEEMLHRLGDGEFHVHLAAEGQHHDEERKPARRVLSTATVP